MNDSIRNSNYKNDSDNKKWAKYWANRMVQDESLHAELLEYLEERGINTALALFIPDWCDFLARRASLVSVEKIREFLH